MTNMADGPRPVKTDPTIVTTYGGGISQGAYKVLAILYLLVFVAILLRYGHMW